ncbi:acetyl-CoA C-acyltransferase [Paractinoplanes maris]|uniref:acetyl-CoA C-acyltransferase n=1 Tax=Paractinoplanes maris TaxID=1734446 RepID=UPI0020219D5E|nr:acetyl-CoA C-acyltransferase [Actinoplanes maris]
MRDAVIVGAVRTPIGRRGGGLAGVHPVELSAHVLRALAERSGFEPADVDDVHWGCVSQVAEQSWNIGRNAVLAAGWPESVPGTTIDRQCGSSQQALHFAAATVISGQADLVVAGGVESMTRVPMGSSGQGADPYGESVRTRYGVDSFDQGVGAEMVAERWGFSRAQLEEFALSSHAAAARAQDSGEFDAEIEPIAGVKQDEGIRRDTTSEKLATLRTPFKTDGRITAGTASQISDGAAALAVTTSEWAAAHGLRPLARVHTAVIAAADPVIVLTAPMPATAKALARSGLSIDDLGVYEVNEAFAPVPLAWLAETGADRARLNPRGGAIALGHPLGASGARIMTTMLHHMRQSGVRYGLQTMCEGAGMANATIVEAL